MSGAPSAGDVARMFGVPIENVRSQYLANAETLDEFAAKAEAAPRGVYRQRSAACWRESAAAFRARACA